MSDQRSSADLAAAGKRKAAQMSANANKFFDNANPELQKTEISQAWDQKEEIKEGVTKDVFGRRAWDQATYDKIAKEKEELGSDGEVDDLAIPVPASQRLHLQRRNAKLALERNIGKTIVQTDATHKANQAGYYCHLCKVHVKDSQSWLDHINGIRHQKMMGMKMAARPATLEEVLERIQELRVRKLQQKKAKNPAAFGLLSNPDGTPNLICDEVDNIPLTADDILAKMEKLENEAEKNIADRKEKRRRKMEKKKELEELEKMEKEFEEEEDEEMAMMKAMGLPTGFG
ncbi:unnamed protein product [Amoebophrya sp. A120]|nr:unnamed protein product [Amoebophrya sp. A120]|eukprot:GSA120T00006991001.1